MKNLIISISILFCVLTIQNTHSQNKSSQKKAVFIILDGISSDVIEKTETPYLDEISQVGGYARAYVGGDVGTYSQTPTISAVGYNSLLTGTWVHKHNVLGNSIKNPNYHYWNLFRIVEEHDPLLKTAIFSTWLDNRTKLVGEGLKEAGNFNLDYSFDGFELDTINFPHDDQRQYISNIDEHVSKEAERYIVQNGPDLSWVYLEFTDDMGHKYGDSPQFYKSIELADKQVGRVWEAIKKREEIYNEDWMIAITTDHGRNAETGQGHGGQSDRERSTWIVTNQETNAYFQNKPGIVDIMPSIMRHLEIKIPEDLEYELDATPFIDEIAISNLSVLKDGNSINLTWNSYGKNQDVKIYICTTNNFKLGDKDEYCFVVKTGSHAESATINIQNISSNFYKILIKTKLNSLNKWIVIEK